MPVADRNPSRARLRQLAWLLALLLAILAWRVSPSPVSLPLRLAGAGVFAAGTLWASLFRKRGRRLARPRSRRRAKV